MRLLIGVLSGLMLLTAARPTAAAEAAELARAETVADLDAVRAIETGDGCSVRLGFAEPDAGGPWVVLYCLATQSDEAPPDDGPDEGVAGEPLGPVWYTLEGRGCPKVQRASVRRAAFAARPGPLLWCEIVPLPAETATTLTILGAKDHALARHEFEQPRKARPHLWHTFVSERGAAAADNAAAAADGEPGTVVADRSDAARPRLVDAIVPPRRGAGDDRPVLLPGAADAGEADGLKLSLNGGVIVITADRPMIDRPARHLLARWWVNGEPVVARPVERQFAHSGFGQVRQTNGFRVGLGLPESLGKLKPGDRVGLQVLYCPAGFDRVSKTGAMKQLMEQVAAASAVPLLSNNLEFELTRELLAAARAED